MNRPVSPSTSATGLWADLGFEVEITEDGSPSLRQLTSAVDAALKGESMHHSGGAAAETELIYGTPIRACFGPIPAPHFISVGLGLGYIELVIAREGLSRRLVNKSADFTLESWESVAPLREYFLEWLKGQPLAVEISNVYDRVLSFILKEGGAITPQMLKNVLVQKFENGQWKLHGALAGELTGEIPPEKKAHGILFDAFSAKTTPELWDEHFLKTYFLQATGADAFISTYASRTSLKTALRDAEFEILIRPGFKGKRNSTLAYKGMLKAIFAPAGIS